MLQVVIEGFHCQSCGNSASKDYQSGDSCHHCGGIVRIETSCAWCAELVPEAKFCRCCGFEMVASGNYPAARMLKDAGVDKLELKQRLAALTDSDRTHFTQQYDRFSAGITTLLDEMRVCEEFLPGFGIGFVKQLHGELLNQAPFSKETSEKYAALAKGPFENSLATLARLADQSPLENTRLIAKLALLNSANLSWVEQNHDNYLSEILTATQEYCQETSGLSLALLQTIANWRFYTQAYHSFWLGNEKITTQLISQVKQLTELTRPQQHRLEILKFRLKQPYDNEIISSGLTQQDQDIKFHSALLLQRSDLYKEASGDEWLFLELIKNAAQHYLISDIKLISTLNIAQFKTYINAMPARDRLPDYLHDIFIEKSQEQSSNLELIWTKLSQSKQLSERQKTKLEDIALEQGIPHVVLALENRLGNSSRLIEYLFSNILKIFEMPNISGILYIIKEHKEDFDRYLHHHSFNIKEIFDGFCELAINQSHRFSKQIITANVNFDYHTLATELTKRADELSLLPLFDESLGQMKITKELFHFFDRAFSKISQDDKCLWGRYVSDAVMSEEALILCYFAAFDNEIWLSCLVKKSQHIQIGDQQLTMNEEVLTTLLGQQFESFFDRYTKLLIDNFEHDLCDYMFHLLDAKHPLIKKELLKQLPKLYKMLDTQCHWYHNVKIIELYSPVLKEYFEQLIPSTEKLTQQQQRSLELDSHASLQKQITLLKDFYRVFLLDKTPNQLSQFMIDYLQNIHPSQIELHLNASQNIAESFLPDHEQLTEKLNSLRDEINEQKNAKKEIDNIPVVGLSQAHQDKIHQWMVTTNYDQAWATLTLTYFRSYNDPKAMLALSQLASKVPTLENFEIQYNEMIISVSKAITDKALFNPENGLMAHGSFVIDIFKILAKNDDIRTDLKQELELFLENYQIEIVHESSIKALYADLDWEYPEGPSS